MKAFCTQLAQSGFVAFVPDLYHGKVADSIAGAETLGKALDTNHLQAKADIADATMLLNERVGQVDRGLAVIGFSLGAYYALNLAAADPEQIRSVVIFYGTGAATTATQEQPASVTLPREMSLSRNPTSTTWRNPQGVLAAR